MRLGDRQGFAACHTDLPVHQVQAGDGLSHRVFDLQASVHLHKEEFAAGIEQELHGTCTDVADGLCGANRRLAHGAALLCAEAGRGGFFNDFLVAALNRAVAFVEVQAVAVLVGKHLDLDMPGFEYIFLDQHPRIAKRRQCFTLSRSQCVGQLADVLDHFHALATATRRGF